MNLYHQDAANLNETDQTIEFSTGAKNKYQFGKAYLQNESTIEKHLAVAASRVLVDGDADRVVNTAFAYCFKEAWLSTTGSSDKKHVKNVGQISTILRVLTTKDGSLLSDFDKVDESETEVENISLHRHFINNHDLPANKGKIRGQLPLSI